MKRGFSLIEVLLAVFILGIGVISIAALFPAGIAQQQRSLDDVMGPVVANQAMSIVRGKVTQGDFGTFEEFTPASGACILRAPLATQDGDWTWLRPGVLFDDDAQSNFIDETGALDLFSFYTFDGNAGLTTAAEFLPTNGYDDGFETADPTLYGVPWSLGRWGDAPPKILITQQERYYPMRSQSDPPKSPQYVWDCMFRRFGGRVQVAIFVYRVSYAGGQNLAYVVEPRVGAEDVPPLPLRFSITDAFGADAAWDANGPNNTNDFRSLVRAEVLNPPYDPLNDEHVWQEPGQVLLDQNGNQHRVLSRYRETDPDLDTDVIELVRPVPTTPIVSPYGPPTGPGTCAQLTGMPYYMLESQSNPGFWDGWENNVTDIWYLPRSLETSTGTLSLTPVYVSVKDL